MPEGNGSGRLDRIETSLNQLTEKFHLMVDHHDAEFKQMLTRQVLTRGKMEQLAATQAAEQKRLNTLSENTDKRVADLVGAVRDLIARIPPENLR